MPYNTYYLTPYQKELYKEENVWGKTSNTHYSNIFQSTENGNDGGPFTSDSSSFDVMKNREDHVRTPWGRSRSYAGDGPIQLPMNHRPKCEPPSVLQRTHQHFGSGLFPHPRGNPSIQFYDLTQLKKSDVRSNDELIPRPSTTAVHNKQIKLKFPQEHPLSSHRSRQEMFPRPEPTIPCDPLSEEEDTLPAMNSSLPHVSGSTVVTQKVMGNFARREVFTPQKSTLRKPLISNDRQKIERLQIESPWFSRHEMMTQFNRQYPTVIPKIDLNIQKKRQPIWLVPGISGD